MEALLLELKRHSIDISVSDGNLEIDTPSDFDASFLLDKIRANKEELVSFITGGQESKTAIPVASEQEVYPLSSGQRRLYFLYALDKDSVAYNMPQFFELRGKVDKGRLASGFQQLIARHASLRTGIMIVEGEPVQKIYEEVPFSVEQYDGIERMEGVVSEFVRPFELEEPPLIRVGLCSLGDGHHLLMIDLHHIITDGVSQGVLVKDFISLYQGERLSPLSLQYKDYAEWEQGAAHQRDLQAELGFWQGEFEEEVRILDLPTDHSRPWVKRYAGKSHSFRLSPEVTASLRRVGDQQGATLFMTLLSVFNVLLSKLSGQEDIVIGTPIVGRGSADVDQVVGMFVNTLAIRTRLDTSESFRGLLGRVKEKTLQCYDHQWYPYEQLVEKLNIPREPGRNPLFDVLFTLQNFEQQSLRIPGLELQRYQQERGIAKFDLQLTATEAEGGLLLDFEYSTDLFTASTVARYAAYLSQLAEVLADACDQPLSQISLLSEQERHSVVHAFNDTALAYPRDATIVGLFSEQARADGERPAVSDAKGNRLSYRELDEQSDRLARFLRGKTTVGHKVGIYAERSVGTVVSILGVLKSGCAYLPLDTTYPEERIVYMLTGTEADVIIYHEGQVVPAVEGVSVYSLEEAMGQLLPGAEKEYSLPAGQWDDAAYVMYTSGTTGRPKGVEISNRNVIRLVKNPNYITLSEGTRILLTGSLTFDASTFEIWGSLLNGGSLHLVAKDTLLSTGSLGKVLEAEKINTLWLTTSLYNYHVQEDVNIFRGLDYLLTGGEAASVYHINLLREAFPDVKLINAYGPTENTTFSTCHQIKERYAHKIPIGKPISNTTAYVLDSHLGLTGIGLPGELYVGGDGVGLGYLNDESLNREKFISNPFKEGDRLYRTGDLVRWLPDGTLDFLGRADEQVKIRGYRIELEEIVSRIQEHPDVEDVVVITREHEGMKQLVAYWVGADSVTGEALRSYLSHYLPDYMVPSYCVQVERIPLTPNGKADKRALPEPVYVTRSACVAPSNQIEEGLAEMWGEVLNIPIDEISIYTNFFEAGGHSLICVKLVNSIYKRFNVELEVREIFNNQTIRHQSVLISAKKKSSYKSLEKAPVREAYPLSGAQRRLYFLYEFNKESLGYNMPFTAKLEGAVDHSDIQDTLRRLIAKHEILRTYFHEIDGNVCQVISPEVHFELSSVTQGEKEIAEIIGSLVRPFDLSKAPLLRAGLIATKDNSYLLVIDMHHIITDGISQGLFITDFVNLYNKVALPEPKFVYKDFAEWENKTGHASQKEKSKSFWLSEFAEEISSIQLPYDLSRPKVNSFQGDSINFTIESEQFAKLKTLSKQSGITMFMTVLSIYYIFLRKISQQSDIVIGTPFSGRDHADLETIAGLFVKTIPLRLHLEDNYTFREALKLVKDKTLGYFAHQEYSYEELIEELNTARDIGRNPLFDVFFTYENFENSELKIPGARVIPYDHRHQVSKFDLKLTAKDVDDQLRLTFEYSTCLFLESTVLQFIKYFNQVVTAVSSNSDIRVSEIDILTEVEREHLVSGVNTLPLSHTDQNVITLFDKQVILSPDSIAIVSPDGTRLTYSELDQKSNALAHYLSENYSETSHIIAIYTEPSAEMGVAILGILKAGKAFLPLDPFQNLNRNTKILRDSQCDLVLTEDKFTDELSFLGSKVNIKEVVVSEAGKNYNKLSIKEEDIAYVIYTSGSTGLPKGVEICHKNIVNYVEWFMDFASLDSSSKSILTSSYAFDLGYTSIFPVLLSGGELHLAPKALYQSPEDLLRYIESEGITFLKLTPSLFSTIVRASNVSEFALRELKLIVLGGESLKKDDIQYFLSHHDHIQFINHYGPTETTVGAIANKLDQDILSSNETSIPIGKPVANTACFLLDENKKLVPPGTPGELYISGAGVGRGYLQNKQLTEEKFILNPFIPGERMYGTGDLARYHKDGNIIFLGRKDDQVKIKGYRVETGEIDSLLRSYKGIRENITVVKSIEGNKSLVAYYVADSQTSSEGIRAYLSEHLPEHMLPSYYVQVAAILLTSNGKVDRKVLPKPQLTGEGDFVEPSTEEEALLCDIWSNVLGASKVGVTNNFFSIGGDSIKSIQICSRVRALGYELSVKDIFTYPTIDRLVLQLKKNTRVSDQSVVTGNVPLTGIQHRFFDSLMDDKHHYNQSVMLNFPHRITKEEVSSIFSVLHTHHDALRMVFKQENKAIYQENRGSDHLLSVSYHDLRSEGQPLIRLSELSNRLQAGIDLTEGPLLQVGLYELKDGSRLLIVIHHLVVDGLSWRILLEDIEQLYTQLQQGAKLKLPMKTDSFKKWSEKLNSEYLSSRRYSEAVNRWNRTLTLPVLKIERSYPEGSNTRADVKQATFSLSKDQTSLLLGDVHRRFNTQINDLLLAGFAKSVWEQYGQGILRLDLEGHGREHILNNIDISRTVGWFTSIYPILLHSEDESLSGLIKSVKESIRHIPNNGFDYLLGVHHRQSEKRIQVAKKSDILFNYLGQFDTDTEGKVFRIAGESTGIEISPSAVRRYDWEVNGIVREGSLRMSLGYSDKQYTAAEINKLMDGFKLALLKLIDHCTDSSPAELTPSDLTYSKISISDTEELTSRYPVEDIYPLSPMQEGMLFHSLLDEKADHYFIQYSVTLKGDVNVRFVQRAFQQIMDRYPILRTIFLHENVERPLQLVLRNLELPFIYEDIQSDVALNGRGETIAKISRADKDDKFKLDEGPLMRVALYHTAEEEYELMWSWHHILLDGWCNSIILSDFHSLYSGFEKGEAKALEIVEPYATYISFIESLDRDYTTDYWKNYLAGYDKAAIIPGDKNEPENPVIKSKSLNLSAEKTEALHAICRNYNVTLSTLIESAWGILLAKYNSTDDVVFGSVVSGRPTEVAGIEKMIGLFINTIPVRIYIDQKDTIKDVLSRTQDNTINGEKHHYSSLPEIQAQSALGPALINHILVFENHPSAGKNINYPDRLYMISNVNVSEQTNYDLTIIIQPSESISVIFEYNNNKYSSTAISKLIERFETVITQIISGVEKQVSTINILSGKELREIQQLSTAHLLVNYPRDKTLVDLFREQALRYPDYTALVCEGATLTYRELDLASDKIGYQLRQRGVGRDTIVGLLTDRSIDTVIGMLGILKAGGAYLPIDVDYPEDRIQYLLNDSGSSVLLTSQRYTATSYPVTTLVIEELLEQIADQVSLESINRSEDLCYIIYTSGTTGNPKGVMVEHRNVVRLFFNEALQFTFGPSDVWTMFHSPSFDFSVWEMYGALLFGGKLVIVPKMLTIDPEGFTSLLVDERVTVLNQTPSAFYNLIRYQAESAPSGLSLRYVIFGGEALNPSKLREWHLRHSETKLINMYGITETTVHVTYKEIGKEGIAGESKSIGRAIPTLSTYVMDSQGQRVPLGVAGELWIGGEGVTRGYLNRGELTAEKFVRNGYNPEERLYRSGDLVRMDETGELEYLGRIDSQVKVRGYRIELGEIESRMLGHELIREAVVQVRDRAGDKYLVSYYVSDKELDREELRSYLSAFLPDYMLPASFVRIDSIPLTINGKLDKSVLPDISFESENNYVAPSTDTEKQLIQIWASLLSIEADGISITQNFFLSGGHSLNIIALANAIFKVFDLKVSIAEIFSRPTLKEQAIAIDTALKVRYQKMNGDAFEITL